MLSATSMLSLLGSGDGSDSAGTMFDFYGPQFIVSSGGKPLDLFALNKATSRPFSGGPHQQWMLLDDGTGSKVALKSEHNGLFLGFQKSGRVVTKVDPFYWAISGSGGTYKLSAPGFGYSLVVEESAGTLPSTDKRTDLLILECTRVNREKIMKHDSQQITALSPNNPQSFNVIPPVITSASCCALYRRFGVSTHQLALAPPSSVDTLPYGILLMRSAYGEQNSVQAAIVLQLVATLRDSVCHMPPVFYRRTGRGFWDDLAPVFSPVDHGWTFAFALMGLVDLAAVIPGPATIAFTKIPVDQLEVISLDGEVVDTSQWHGGTRCIASFCLQILRALPEHSPQDCV